MVPKMGFFIGVFIICLSLFIIPNIVGIFVSQSFIAEISTKYPDIGKYMLRFYFIVFAIMAFCIPPIVIGILSNKYKSLPQLGDSLKVTLTYYLFAPQFTDYVIIGVWILYVIGIIIMYFSSQELKDIFS